jgi:hypothetical protein
MKEEEIHRARPISEMVHNARQIARTVTELRIKTASGNAQNAEHH